MRITSIILKSVVAGLLGVLLGICTLAPGGKTDFDLYLVSLFYLPLWGLGSFSLSMLCLGATVLLCRRLRTRRPGAR